MTHPVKHNTQTFSREIIDLILQRSTIELFEAYGVAVAPIAGSKRERQHTIPPSHLIGTMHLSAASYHGELLLAVAPATLERTQSGARGSRDMDDWVLELSNQLAGRIKNRLVRYRVSVQVSFTPTAKESAGDVSLAGLPVLEYVFRTLKDDLYVTLSRGFELARPTMDCEPNVADEGDVILF